jgi:GNAT superfamily N-acetyltransferase
MRLRYETPLEEILVGELFEFWERIFGPHEPDVPMHVYRGSEVEHNRNVVYLEREAGELAGTCGMAIGRATPALAGFGEVATEPVWRGRGIAARVCTRALEEFRARGGEAFFLGTDNPAAARIYHRLGWRRLPGSSIWANITSGDSPEEYLVDYFRDDSPVETAVGDASLRVPMIPLLLAPHDWQVLDGNLPVPMLSTRYAVQRSCMGLCRKYYQLVERDDGEWFAARTSTGRLVGIATARIEDGVGHVDGFTHGRCTGSWGELMRAAMTWAESMGASSFATRVSVEDEHKQALFESLGFERRGENGKFDLGERRVAALEMTRS